MKTVLQNPLFKFLASLRLAAALLLVVGVASGVATFVESHYSSLGSTQTGRAAAYDLIYDATWFNVVLVVLTLNLVFNLIERLARGRHHPGFLLVHIGMIVIMVGAGITRWFGFEGYLRIREGQANNVMASAKDYAIVRAGDQQAEVNVRLYRPGEQDIGETVSLGDQSLKLGVVEYWPRFERTMVPGEGGVAAVTLGMMGGQGLQMETLREGEELRSGGTTVRFHRDGLPPLPADAARYGLLRVRAGGETCSLPIAPAPGELGVCGGYTFRLAEFHSDYSTEGASDPEGPLRNPMVRIEITTPAGEVADRTLFALHPEFDLVHEQDIDLTGVDLVYEVASGVDLARVDGQVVVRSATPLDIVPMAQGGEATQLAAGEVAPLATKLLYRNEAGLRMVPSEIQTSLVSVPAHSRNRNAPPAARLFLEKDGERAQAVCMHGGAPQRVELGGQDYQLSYGSVMRALPYELFLEDFVLETYPGSDNPASYESHVLLNDPEKGIEGEPVRIWMNNPLNHRGAKHFQSSYDRDRGGTVLSVNKDPGKWPTYIGYTIFSLGFLVVFGRVAADRVKARHDKAARRNAPRGVPTAAAALMVLIAGLLAGPASAQQDHPGDDHSGHDHSGHTHAPAAAPAGSVPPQIALDEESREMAGRLIVQDFRGRMKPLDTLARETVMKVTKTNTFEGRHPIDVFLGFAVFSQQWYHYPTIVVKNPGVQDLLGVSHDTHHVSLGSLLQGGGYSLQAQAEAAHRTPPNERDKTTQRLISFDERVHILYSALQGTSLRIFPIPDDPGHKWEGIQTVLESLPEGDPRRDEFRAAADALFLGLEEHDVARTREGLRLTAALQEKYGAEVMPEDFRVDAEMTLNSLHPFERSTLPYLGGFVLLIVAYFWGLFRRDERPWKLREPLYGLGMLLLTAGFLLHTYGFALRWIASARAPLSNGHESLLWVALTVAFAGLVFELASRTAAAGALGALLAALVLGVSFMSAFDPAIGPLVPVLASYWLNIHVTIITASYGFLGLCALLGGLTLILLVMAGLTRRPLGSAIAKLDRLNVDAMIVGIGMLAVGTLLGGVWANESWGRYWGWDPKETWALVSILVYALILHFRWIPKLSNVYVQAVGSFLGIWSIIMTYFGVNYLLSGLHSYAAGDAVTIPTWVIGTFAGMLAMCVVGWFAWRDARPTLAAR